MLSSPVSGSRPGLLLRSPDRLLRNTETAAERDDVLAALGSVLGSVSGRVLCSVREHLTAGATRDTAPVTFLGVHRPDGLPAGSTAITLDVLNQLIPHRRWWNCAAWRKRGRGANGQPSRSSGTRVVGVMAARRGAPVSEN